MNRELLGGIAIVILLLTAITHWRSTPDKGDYKPAANAFPRVHLYKGADDVEASLDIRDHEGHGTGRLVLDDGRVYVPKDGSIQAIRTADIYLIDQQWDIGTFAGYRGAATDALSVGFRVSPVRLLYGTTSPDIVLAKDWAGAGLSFYLPPELVGRTASHFGVGAWYGAPFASADSGVSSWTYGLSFSTH